MRPRKSKDSRACADATATTVAMESALSDSTPAGTIGDYQSTVARHLAGNVDCARRYNDASFTVLTTGRSKYHLDVLEAAFLFTHKPNLCIFKKTVSPHWSFFALTRTHTLSHDFTLSSCLELSPFTCCSGI